MPSTTPRLSAVRDPLDVYIAGLDGMPENFLACRESQHRWDVLENFRIVDAGKESDRRARGGHTVYAERVLVCERCGMERSDAYHISSFRGRTALQRINASYTAPDGYSIEGVGNNIKGMRDLVHGAMFDRVLNQTPVRKPGRPRKTTA